MKYSFRTLWITCAESLVKQTPRETKQNKMRKSKLTKKCSLRFRFRRQICNAHEKQRNFNSTHTKTHFNCIRMLRSIQFNGHFISFWHFFHSIFSLLTTPENNKLNEHKKNSHSDSTHVCISCFRKCFERFCIFCAIHWCWCVLLRAPFSVCMRQKHFNCSMDARRLCVWYFLHYLAAAVRTYRMSLLCSVSTCCCANCVRYTNTYVCMRVWVFVYSNVSMQWLTKLQSKPNVEYIQKKHNNSNKWWFLLYVFFCFLILHVPGAIYCFVSASCVLCMVLSFAVLGCVRINVCRIVQERRKQKQNVYTDELWRIWESFGCVIGKCSVYSRARAPFLSPFNLCLVAVMIILCVYSECVLYVFFRLFSLAKFFCVYRSPSLLPRNYSGCHYAALSI